MIANNITRDNVQLFKKLYLISINDSIGENSISYFDSVITDNVLVLRFDDTDSSHPITLLNGITTTLDAMSEEQGQLIFDFIKKIPDGAELIIHCTAGQNRSGSVGKFATEYFKQDMKEFMTKNPIVKGNATVTRILNNIWLWGHYKN